VRVANRSEAGVSLPRRGPSARRRRSGPLAALFVCAWVCIALSQAAHAQVLDQRLWGTSGNVSAVVRSGSTLYVAGALGEVGPSTGGGVPLSRASGLPVSGFPRVTGYVSAVVPDGTGGWFVGGDFTAVGGIPRASLAHILADGSLAPWAPAQDAHSINRMVLSGGTLYVAGDFSVIDGEPRTRLAAFDATTGDLLAWAPVPSGTVGPYSGPNVIGLAAVGDTVFVGGNFAQINGVARAGLAAVDGRTGQLLGWYPGPANDEVDVLTARRGIIYLGGYFTSVAGQPRNRAAAVDLPVGTLLPWSPNVTGPDDAYVGPPRLAAIVVGDSAVYLGGQFLSVGGVARNALAAVDPDSGRALAWNPGTANNFSYPYPYVQSLALQDDTVYVGGNFELLAGAARSGLGAIGASTAVATSWDPRPDPDKITLALSASAGLIYAGGTFGSVGPWQPRANLAAFDLATGAVKDWNPNDNGIVATGLIVSGGKVYVAGDFSFIGGQPRSGLAALDTLTGAALPWNPATDNWVNAMILSGGVLYVGGQFSTIGGASRFRAAALDTSTGMATAWDPGVDDDVTALAAKDRTIYLGGYFRSVGGQPRMSMASVDAATAALGPWRADCDGAPYAMVVSDSTVFAGGEYLSSFGGQARTDIAALDATSGAVRPWDAHLSGSIANPSPSVNALTLVGHTLYVGGDFYSLGGQIRPCLAALDDSVGLATSWAPQPDFPVRALSASGGTLYAGGIFGAMNLQPCQGLAALSIPTDATPSPRPPAFALAQNFPNPARGSTTIRFTLAETSIATVIVYDIAGRRVATPLRRVPLTPGPHDVSVALGSFKPGVYLYRLEAAGRSATRKMLVAR